MKSTWTRIFGCVCLCLAFSAAIVGCGGPGDTPTGDANASDVNEPENAGDAYVEGEKNVGEE